MISWFSPLKWQFGISSDSDYNQNIYSEIIFYAIQPSQKGFLWASQTRSRSYISSWKDLSMHRWAQQIHVISVVPHLTFKCALTLEVSHVFEHILVFILRTSASRTRITKRGILRDFLIIQAHFGITKIK